MHIKSIATAIFALSLLGGALWLVTTNVTNDKNIGVTIADQNPDTSAANREAVLIASGYQTTEDSHVPHPDFDQKNISKSTIKELLAKYEKTAELDKSLAYDLYSKVTYCIGHEAITSDAAIDATLSTAENPGIAQSVDFLLSYRQYCAGLNYQDYRHAYDKLDSLARSGYLAAQENFEYHAAGFVAMPENALDVNLLTTYKNKSLEYLNMALQRGSKQAAHRLSVIYDEGRLVQQNIDESIRYHKIYMKIRGGNTAGDQRYLDYLEQKKINEFNR